MRTRAACLHSLESLSRRGAAAAKQATQVGNLSWWRLISRRTANRSAGKKTSDDESSSLRAEGEATSLM